MPEGHQAVRATQDILCLPQHPVDPIDEFVGSCVAQRRCFKRMECNHQCYGLALERVRRAFTVDSCVDDLTRPWVLCTCCCCRNVCIVSTPTAYKTTSRPRYDAGLAVHPVWCGSGALIHPIPRNSQDDYCNICWVEGLGAKPCISLTGCGHLFHYDCAKKKLARPPSPSYTTSRYKCSLYLHNRPRAGPQP